MPHSPARLEHSSAARGPGERSHHALINSFKQLCTIQPTPTAHGPEFPVATAAPLADMPCRPPTAWAGERSVIRG